MKKRLNHTFLLVSAIIIILMVVLFSFIFYQLLCEEVSESLQNNAVILENALETSDNESEIEKKMNFENLRVTIVDKEGKVIFDNFADTKQMDNHKDRPEIDDALETGEGSCVRHSDTLAKNTFYYALRRTDGTVLRVGKESDSIYSILLEILPEIIAIIALIFVVSWILTLLFAKNIIKPIQRMAEDMDSIEEKDGYKELVPFIRKIKTQHEDIMKSATMRQEFTANVSHELKTPLTSISGYAELMENNLVDGENVVNFASAIHKNADRLLTLINDIIRLSELDGVQAAPEFEELDLYAIVQNCVQTLQVNARNHNVSISAKGTGQLIKANRQMIEELVYNLCDNAIRYNKEGGKVEAGVARTREGVQLIVQDNGIGIPKEHQERIFERFYRVDKSRSKETGGTGLGLAIVKHIAQVHNASLEVISEEGQGTKILVTFHA